MYLFPHTYVHSLGIPPRQKTYIMYACTHTYMQNRIPPKPEKPALKGKGKGWLRFGPASETVQQNGARTRDLFVGFPARRAPDTLVKSHGADGRAGWNYGPASEGGVGQTGFEPTPAVFRRRGSNARGLSAWWVQTRLRRYLRARLRESRSRASRTPNLCVAVVPSTRLPSALVLGYQVPSTSTKEKATK
jgi:hypothetical protein